MPRVEVLDVAHAQNTDHRIPRVPPQKDAVNDSSQTPSPQTKLSQFPTVGAAESARDLALAWTGMAASGSEFALAQAEKFLPQAVTDYPEDADLLAALAFDEEQHGPIDEARREYEHALRIKPLSLDAAGNLALIEASSENYDRATALWKSAFERAPGRSTFGTNLARSFCLSGHGKEAKDALVTVLEFNPDSSLARQMLQQLESGEVTCGTNK